MGLILRSDVPTSLSKKDVILLENCRLNLVVDLRPPNQAIEKTSAFQYMKDINYINCRFRSGNRIPKFKSDVINICKELLSDHQNIAYIARLILNTNGTILFHCTAGKDRTILIIALLLSVAEVNKEDIIADYVMSYLYIKPIIEDIKKRHPNYLIGMESHIPKQWNPFLNTLETLMNIY